MGQKIFHIFFILFPVSFVLTFLLIRIFKIVDEKGNYLIIFSSIFGILTLIYLIFTVWIFVGSEYLWGQVLLFAFTHKNAIYTNALDCGRPRSFYRWAGERGKISSWRDEISVSPSSLQWNFSAFAWDFWDRQKTRPDPNYLVKKKCWLLRGIISKRGYWWVTLPSQHSRNWLYYSMFIIKLIEIIRFFLKKNNMCCNWFFFN